MTEMGKISRGILTLVIIFLIAGVLYGQKGKITGVVTDHTTNEALIGVNVFLEGTTIGTTTDVDGKYVILNLQPGTYNLAASMVGYGKVTIQDVVVNIDRTTEVNFILKDESIQMEQIVIRAEQPKIVKDRTSTSNTIESDQIKAAPIEGLRGALDLSASFEKNERGDYSVRGSGAHEVQFQINGVAQSTSNTSIPGYGGIEKANNSWKYDVNPLGVQQVQMITGGFSAEYGNAQAGVVKVALKEGTPKFAGEVRMEYRPAGQYHWGDYLYDPNNYEWNRWGNVDFWFENRDDVLQTLDNGLYTRIKNGTATEEDLALADETIRWAHSVWLENHTPSEDNPLGVYDYTDRSYKRFLVGFGGPLGKNPELLKFYFSGEYRSKPTRLPTPERDQIYQNYILNLSYHPFKAHAFKFTTNYQKYVGGLFSGSDDIRWSGLVSVNESGKYHINFEPVRTEVTFSQSINWIYTIDNNSFVDATFSYQDEKYELPYEYLITHNLEADRLDSLNDPAGILLKRGPWWDPGMFRPLEAASTNFYQDYRAKKYSLRSDYTNQYSKSNLLKAGVSFDYWDLVNIGVNSSYRASSYLAWFGFAEYYKAYPVNFAAYIQDKVEIEGMVANLGVRVEGYNFQTQVPVDKFNYFYPGTSGQAVGDPSTKPSDTHYLVLPRAGISFPIGENTAFRIQYGHFASIPIFTQALTTKTYRGWSSLGDPDLEPKKTINYEFGLQQVVDEAVRIDMALYYNDRISQIGSQKIASLTGDQRDDVGFTEDNQTLFGVQSYDNNAFGVTTGLEVTIEKVNIRNWSYRLSYNLSQTTEGKFGAEVIYPDYSRSAAVRGQTGEFLSAYDRTHNFRGIIQYILRDDEGFEIFGVKPFANAIFSLTYSARSGLPYTYVTEFDQLQDVRYNRRYPLESNFDFSFTKDIVYDNYKFIVAIRVMNLFDNKWLTPMESNAESDIKQDWIQRGVTIDNPADDPGRKFYQLYSYRAYRNVPRQVYLTLGFGF